MPFFLVSLLLGVRGPVILTHFVHHFLQTGVVHLSHVLVPIGLDVLLAHELAQRKTFIAENGAKYLELADIS